MKSTSATTIDFSKPFHLTDEECRVKIAEMEAEFNQKNKEQEQPHPRFQWRDFPPHNRN